MSVVQDANQLTVTQPAVQVSVVNGVTVLEVTEQPVVLTVTEVTPVIQIADVGVQGPPGPQGPAGDSTGLGFHVSVTNQSLVQIVHGMPFPPAGIVCLDTGTPPLCVEYATVSYPSTGVLELTFGFPFTGQIYLS